MTFIGSAVVADSVKAVCYLEALGSADSPEVVRSVEAQRSVGFAEVECSAKAACSADSPAAEREEPVGFGSKPEPIPSPDLAPA